MLRLLQERAGRCPRYTLMLSDYRLVADTLGCRGEFEAALERLVVDQQAAGSPIR